LVEAFVVVLAFETSFVSAGGFGPGAHDVKVDASGDGSSDEFGAGAAAVFCQALLEATILAKSEVISDILAAGTDRLVKAKEIDHSNLPVNEEKNSRNAENTEEARSTPRNYSLFSLCPLCPLGALCVALLLFQRVRAAWRRRRAARAVQS
jgi:hypothetical protein